MPGIAGIDAALEGECEWAPWAGEDALDVGMSCPDIPLMPGMFAMPLVSPVPFMPDMSTPDIESPFKASLSARQSPGLVSCQGL